MAKQAAAVDDRAVVAWLDQAEAGADSSDSAGLAALRALARSRPALAADLLTAARAGGVPDLAKALAATVDPTLALMRATDLNRLAARLVAAAKG
jgi:hypothetical protein